MKRKNNVLTNGIFVGDDMGIYIHRLPFRF